jgi:hypothetical protein
MPKGFKMEERLRAYFLDQGFYVVRGVPYWDKGIEITDIDLWLYGRSSPMHRDISVVDVKNKREPKAVERLLWVKGLSMSIGADHPILATSDKRAEIESLGEKNGVLVLGGDFMQRISKYDSWLESRLSDEELHEIIDQNTLGKLAGDLKGALVKSRGLLAGEITFDKCNMLLSVAKFYLGHILTNVQAREVALRCFYYVLSLFSLVLDYLMKDLSFIEIGERKKKLIEGFLYGEGGRRDVEFMLSNAIKLMEQQNASDVLTLSKAKSEVLGAMDDDSYVMLGEYFSRGNVSNKLFSLSKELEAMSMAREFFDHKNSSVELRSLIAVLIDFWGIPRIDLAEAMPE